MPRSSAPPPLPGNYNETIINSFIVKMKMKKSFAVLLMGLAVAACSGKPAGDDVPKEFRPSKAQVDSVSYLIGINFGSFIKTYDFGSDLNYSEIVKGIKDFVAAEGNPQDADFTKQFKVDPNEMNRLFNSYLETRRAGIAQGNKAKADKFLAENGKRSGVVTTDSGLQYKILEAGNDVKPGPQDTVWVRYKGTLIDGTVFDEVAAEDEPLRLMLNRVVPGWTEGLQLIGEGGKIDLYLPAELGYGESGNQAIGPNSALIFNVELTKVGKYEAPAPEEE